VGDTPVVADDGHLGRLGALAGEIGRRGGRGGERDRGQGQTEKPSTHRRTPSPDRATI